ncbi:translocon-associated protein subunit beta-like [Tripterygium wilfordii]|uniref:Translocon-associated protein subunit beta-like n=1 Tax=Tripterygium wilfordii TaxID=458696 RepID=A0A7J7CDP9_TRIWF|nr:translocon-associated protein subunit beta-like [Tripterygium wilfordii]
MKTSAGAIAVVAIFPLISSALAVSDTLFVVAHKKMWLILVICSGSVVSHSFALESEVKGVFYGAHAVITFGIPTKTELQVEICYFVSV